MKTMHKLAVPLLAIGLGLSIPFARAAGDAKTVLMKEAKVTESQAQATALSKVPNGTVQSSELEKEGGRLIWSFDIARPSVKGVTEVHVDAKTGKIVSVKRETVSQEAREAKTDAAKEKPEAPKTDATKAKVEAPKS